MVKKITKNIIPQILIFSALFGFLFCFNIFTAFGSEQEIPFNSNIFRSECFGGTAYFYTNIPSSYSGSKVSLEAKPSSNPSGCADLGIDLCNWASGCQVPVTPGQKLSFQVSVYCGYCGDYESQYWYVYAKAITGPVCGNKSCESGETCSSCSTDCGACGPVCGNKSCESGETCSSCSADCGSCQKSDGSSCNSASECAGGYCVHSNCRSASTYCGDGYCESGETYSNCANDCYLKLNSIEGCERYQRCVGSVCVVEETCEQEEKVKKSDGDYCDKSEECKSNNCQNYRCCVKGKICCLSTNNCQSGYYCADDKHYCLPGKPDGQLCAKDEFCSSGNCENGICCAWGQKCCQKHRDCGSKEYCDDDINYCKYKFAIGEKCNGAAMCNSGYCDSADWTCQPARAADETTQTATVSEKPQETATTKAESKPVEKPAASAPQADVEVLFTNLPTNIVLKKNEKTNVQIGILNKGKKEIILAEAIIIDNQIPFIVDSEPKSTLRIPTKKIKLSSGEKVANDSKDILENLESLTLIGKNAGSGEIKFKAIYFVGGKAETIEGKISVSVSSERIDKEPTASDLFKEQMIFIESKNMALEISADKKATATKEVIFVEPEYKELYEATANSWGKANRQKEEALENLKNDFAGAVKPEIISFFETIEKLNQAKSQQEITAATLRAIAPPAMKAGFDLANLIDAIDKMQKEEKILLNHFDAKEFKIINLPLYDDKKNVIGNTRVMIKEAGDKIYAIKIGDL